MKMRELRRRRMGGMAVAELAVHATESRPDDTKVSLNGIEELVADKGYLSGAVLKRVKSYGVRSYIPEKRQKGNGTGRARWKSNRRSTKTGGASKATTARGC